MDRGVPYSIAHAPVRAAASDLGRKLHAQYPAHPRENLLGAAAAGIHPESAVLGRRAARVGSEGTSKFQMLPFVVSSANRNFTPGSQADLNGDWGFDAKFGVTPA